MTARPNAIRRIAYLCVALAALPGCGPREKAATPGTAAALTKLQVNFLPYVSFGPYCIALEEGYFTAHGLDVELVRLKRSALAVPILAQGDLDVLAGALSISILNAIARGCDLRIVADKGYVAPDRCSYTALMARPDLVAAGALDDPARIRGMRVATALDNCSAYMIDKTLRRHGLGLDDIDARWLPPAATGEALRKGAVDIAHTAEPWVTRIVDAGDGVVWQPDTGIIPDFQITYIAFGPALLRDDPDAGRRFMAAYLQGVRQYREGKTERNLAILERHTGLDRDLLKRACWPAFREDLVINVDSVVDFQRWAVERGLMDRAIPPEKFWDDRFARHALAALGGTGPDRVAEGMGRERKAGSEAP